jgi:LacI family transcriptional regulator
MDNEIFNKNKITIKDIAKVAKVSPATVSLVINDKAGISKNTRYRVLRIIRNLNYTPNLVARSLVKRQSKSIAMLITNTRNPVFPEIAEGVDNALKKYGYSLIIITTYDEDKLEAKEIKMVKARGIDGIITSAARLDSENIVALAESGFPTICVLRRIYNCNELDHVVADNFKGGYLAAEHLIRMGHRRIGIIKGQLNASTFIERFNGASKAFKVYGVPILQDLIQQGDNSKESGYLATNKLMKLRPNRIPTAIFACNDEMAIGALESLYDTGLKIPNDVALVGFNNAQTTALRTIEITTINQRNYEMGYLAAKRLIDKIEKKKGYKNPFHIILDPELLIRKSCGYSISSKYKINKIK